jgi:hypothetical protein
MASYLSLLSSYAYGLKIKSCQNSIEKYTRGGVEEIGH